MKMVESYPKVYKTLWEKKKFDVNGRKFLIWVENAVGKGEIVHYKQSLLFPQCFQRLVLQTSKTSACLEKGLTLSHAETPSKRYTSNRAIIQ